MRITVIVPTYRRPKDLERCLEALEKQTRPADEVLVIVRDTDAETWVFLEAFNPEVLPIRPVTLSIPGQVAALNAGLDRAQGDIIAITDDDAAPRGNWLADIETHFESDHRIGGVGGRDWVHLGNYLENGARERVGRVQWYGRVIGNHHLGVGLPREVDVLKGANMSYRRTAISGLRFDQRLRGTGAQVHNDLGFSLALRKAGWKLIYDPGVAVDHYPAQRFDDDQRGIVFSDTALINAAHNETIVLLDYFPILQRIIFIVWSTLVGTQIKPGFLQCLRSFPKEGLLAGQKWFASLRGRWQGWLSWKKCLG